MRKREICDICAARRCGSRALELAGTLLAIVLLTAWNPAAAAAAPPASPGAAAQPAAGELSQQIGPVSVLQARPGIYMLTVDGTNVAVETGPDGTVVVDTGPNGASQALLKAIRQVASSPIRYLVNTSADPDRIGGNAMLADAGYAFSAGVLGRSAPVIAHQNALLREITAFGTHVAPEALPSEIFTRPQRNSFINGQAMQVLWMPAAHTDGDSMVVFRRSDVVVTGAIFDPTHFPVIDLEHGGSIQGEIDALNRLLDDIAVAVTPEVTLPGGTLIIPGRGQLCDQGDVLNYRDMVTIVRDRIQAWIDQGMNLRQIEAADPTQGYNNRYGSDTGSWTTRNFVEAVYKGLVAQKRRPKAAHDNPARDSE